MAERNHRKSSVLQMVVKTLLLANDSTEWKAQINSWLEVSVYRRKRILKGALCVQGRERGRELGDGKGALLSSCALPLK